MDCQIRHVAAALWASPYEVSGSFGLGRHQGLGILAVGYSYDPRGARQGVTQTYSLPADINEVMVGQRGTPHDHANALLCSKVELLFDRPLGNHGRSLSREAAHKANRAPMLLYAADAPSQITESANSNAVLGGAWMKRVTSCLDEIKDGYCDSVCGNCSYVLPPESIMTSRAGEWSNPGGVVLPAASCNEASYCGGPGQVSSHTFTGAALPNSYTHCARIGCSADDEAPSFKTLTSDSVDAPMTGRYGHNSNTDAEAEFLAFKSCMNGQDGRAAACAVCGTGAAPKQDPCGAKTNTARAIWNRTAEARGGFLPLDKVAAILDRSGPTTVPPLCAWAPFLVHGM